MEKLNLLLDCEPSGENDEYCKSNIQIVEKVIELLCNSEKQIRMGQKRLITARSYQQQMMSTVR